MSFLNNLHYVNLHLGTPTWGGSLCFWGDFLPSEVNLLELLILNINKNKQFQKLKGTNTLLLFWVAFFYYLTLLLSILSLQKLMTTFSTPNYQSLWKRSGRIADPSQDWHTRTSDGSSTKCTPWLWRGEEESAKAAGKLADNIFEALSFSCQNGEVHCYYFLARCQAVTSFSKAT